jgi:hypothetical protein
MFGWAYSWAIEEKAPFKTELRDELTDLLEVQGFYKMSARAEALSFPDTCAFARLGKDDDIDMTRAFIAFDSTDDFQGLVVWEAQIEENQLRAVGRFAFRVAAFAEDKFQRFRAIADNMNTIGDSSDFECFQCACDIAGVVLNEEDIDRRAGVNTLFRNSASSREITQRLKKSREGYLKGAGEFFNGLQRSVAGSPLDIGQIGTMQACTPSEFFLRDARSAAPILDGKAEAFL